MPDKKPKRQAANYQQLRSELDAVLAELQSEDLDIDEALKRYERGLELTARLEEYLKSAENTVREIKARFDSAE